MADARDGSPKPARFAMPFELVDSAGQVVFKVEETANGPILKMTSGSKSIHLGMNAGGSALQLSSGSDVASAAAGSNASIFRSKVGNVLTTLGTEEADTGMQIDVGEMEQVHIGIKPTKNAAARVFKPDGSIAVQLGSNPAAQGNGTLYVYGANGEPAAHIEAKEDGGYLGISNGSQPLASLSPGRDGSAGKIGIFTPDGNQVFAAGAVGGRGVACAYGNNRQQCLNP
ncbi:MULTISPECIES: hypothetical protein [unclassified Chelatococcus]|uniref:hypothetical protein n=1 Tax=unclassified Chelatococcus TaxID=2638111 RepID=UPI001BCA72E2|nr:MULTISPECIES: hypothetical protein [unclassified Chelatococcus]MBS7696215.1 hypothetical protein [Chelatococcus sp. YT9]MBX3557758.1 hypothetical protein [Chelatococcus sp.]